MCGRVSLFTTKDRIKTQFQVDELPDISTHFNIPPSFPVLFVVQMPEEGRYGMNLRWGLIPSWATNKKKYYANARSEGVETKPAFRPSFQTKRGLMIVNGFYEWQREVSSQPYYFKQDHDNLLAFAGLWDTWQSREGEVIHSCCLLTTTANGLMEPIHNRMPVILTPEAQAIWLDETSEEQVLLSLLNPYLYSDLCCYPVTKKMNKAQYDVHDAVIPLKR